MKPYRLPLFPSPRTLTRCSKGMAMVEFALTLPILVTLLFGVIELSRYALMHQKLDKAATSLADFVSQGETITQNNLDTYSDALTQILDPFSFDGTVIFSSVLSYPTDTGACAAGVSCIVWQYSPTGGQPSQIGVENGEAFLPGGYGIFAGQNAVVVELYGNFRPLLPQTAMILPTLQDHLIYKIAIFKPRLGTLFTLD